MFLELDLTGVAGGRGVDSRLDGGDGELMLEYRGELPPGPARSRERYLAGGSSAELPLSTRDMTPRLSAELRVGRYTGGLSASVPSSSLQGQGRR